jgi:lysophospholipase L1-like esterase
MTSAGSGSGFTKWFALVAINGAALVAMVVCIELVFGDWFAPYVPPDAAVIERSISYRQNLYEPAGEVFYSRDRYGLRGVHEPLDRIALVTVGGSTTDQRYITDGETWQDALRAAAGIAVANAGVDGMSSFGHITAVREWLHEIPGLKPKYYLHYIGVNDASMSAETERFDRSGHDSNLFRTALRRSVLAKAAVRLWLGASGAREVSHGRIVARGGNDAAAEAVDVDTTRVRRFVEEVYKPNLARLIALHRQRGEKVIFVSQTTHPGLIRWKDGKPLVTAEGKSVAPYAAALGLVNAATATACGGAEGCYFFDLAGKVAFEPGDFYDLVHSTPAGARKIGDFLAAELKAIESVR